MRKVNADLQTSQHPFYVMRYFSFMNKVLFIIKITHYVHIILIMVLYIRTVIIFPSFQTKHLSTVGLELKIICVYMYITYVRTLKITLN